MPLVVGLETQEVPLTAIAIPSMVEVEVQAGRSTVTEMALYNVQEFWTTWFVQSCASRDICKRVTGMSEGLTLMVDDVLEDKPLTTAQHPCGNVESCLEQIGTVRNPTTPGLVFSVSHYGLLYSVCVCVCVCVCVYAACIPADVVQIVHSCYRPQPSDKRHRVPRAATYWSVHVRVASTESRGR
jgi:hypothetical protein